MAWIWRYRGDDGETPDNGESETFSSQSDAETWLGERWRELLADGVVEVRLEEDGRVEYAMPLTAPE